VMASYPPGSVFKLVNGLIGLEEGVLKPSNSYPCHGGFFYGAGRKLGCHAHSSPLQFKDAIATSCNGYFCYVMKNVLENKQYGGTAEALDKWREYASVYPKNWYNGYDQSYIIRSDVTYNVRAIPSLYVLDSEKKVIMKDAPVEVVIPYLDNLK